MAETLGKAVLEIRVDGKQYKVALKQVNKEADNTATRIQGIGRGVSALVFVKFASIAVRALKTVTRAVDELGRRGAAVDDVSTAFSTLSENMGSTADVMIGALRAGVKGTLSDFDLMKTANKALGAGLITSADDMKTLAAGARSLGKATGIDTKQAFEQMTTAIASGRTAQLKQLGLFVDNKVATENFATALGKTVSKLTDAERAQALSAATLVALRERLALVKPAAADFGEQMDKLKVSFDNFRDAAGVITSKVIPEIITQFQTAGLEVSGFSDVTLGSMNVFANVVVNAVQVALNAMKGLVEAVAAAGSTVASHAQFMWDVLSGKMGIREALESIALTTQAGLLAIEQGLIKVINPTLQWKDYLAETIGTTETLAEVVPAAMTTVTEALGTTIAEQARLLELQKARFAESSAELVARNAETHASMLLAVQDYHASVKAAAAEAGFKTRAELQRTAAKALVEYNNMKRSGIFTARVLQDAWEKAEQAKRDASEKTAEFENTLAVDSVAALGTILTQFAGENKALMVAGAILSGIAAIQKAWASAPFPANLPGVAVVAAATIANVLRIKSSKPGLATGTPGLDFASFGAASSVDLHGQEAVVPRGGGHLLAGEIASAMPGSDAAQLDRLDRIAESLDDLPSTMTRAWKNAMASA